MTEIRPTALALLSPEVKQTLVMYGHTLDGRLLSWNDFAWSFRNLRENFTRSRLGGFTQAAEHSLHRDWRLNKDGSIFKPRLALSGRRLETLEAYSGLGHYVRVTMAMAESSLDITLRPSNLFDSRQQSFYVGIGKEIDDPVNVMNTPVLTRKEQKQPEPVPMAATPPEVVSALYLLG